MKNVYDLLAASKHMYMHEYLEVVSFLIYGLYEFKRFQDQPCSYSRKTITNMNPIKIRLLQKIIENNTNCSRCKSSSVLQIILISKFLCFLHVWYGTTVEMV